jgi:hypothetical protein
MMEQLYPGRNLSHTLFAAMLTQRGWNHIVDDSLASLEHPSYAAQADGNGGQPWPDDETEKQEEELRANVSEYLQGECCIAHSVLVARSYHGRKWLIRTVRTVSTVSIHSRSDLIDGAPKEYWRCYRPLTVRSCYS